MGTKVQGIVGWRLCVGLVPLQRRVNNKLAGARANLNDSDKSVIHDLA